MVVSGYHLMTVSSDTHGRVSACDASGTELASIQVAGPVTGAHLAELWDRFVAAFDARILNGEF